MHLEALDRFDRDLIARGIRNIQRTAWMEIARPFLENISTSRTSKVIYTMTSGDLATITKASKGHPLFDFLAGCVQNEIDFRIPTPPAPIEG